MTVAASDTAVVLVEEQDEKEAVQEGAALGASRSDDKPDCTAPPSQKRRKGRNSVEEIIAEAVAVSLGAPAGSVTMHACGREDIDVRMLGMKGQPPSLSLSICLNSPFVIFKAPCIHGHCHDIH